MSVTIVLGMHRSGTSATAGFFSFLDFFPGLHLISSNEFNPKGYFESSQVIFENDRLLRHFGLSGWSDVRPLFFGVEKNTVLKIKESAIDVFQSEYRGQERKILKDPRLCRLLPVWTEVFSDLGEKAQYMVTLRNPADVVASLSRRDGMHPNQSALLYAIYLMDAERHSRGEVRALVRYAELLNNTQHVLGELDGHLGTSFSATAPEVLARACAFLDPKLDHKPGPVPLPNSPFIDFAFEVHNAFDRQFYDVSPAVFDQLQDKLDVLRSMLEPWLGKSERMEALESQIFVPGQAIYKGASKNSRSTVYWRTQSLNYLESRTLVQTFNFGGDVQTLVFSLPATPDRFLSLRLDLTDRPAFCEVRELSLNDATGCVRWTANGAHGFVSVSDDMQVICDDVGGSAFTVISTGFDPYAELAIPESILTEAGEGWTLTAMVRFRLLSEGTPTVLGRLQSSIRQAEKEQHALKTSIAEVSSLKAELAEKEAALQTQLSEFEALRVQLLRAEAQLELLKDLMISDSELDRL